MGQCLQPETRAKIAVVTEDMIRRSTDGNLTIFQSEDGRTRDTYMGGGNASYYTDSNWRAGWSRSNATVSLSAELDCKVFLFIIYVCIFGAMVTIGVVGMYHEGGKEGAREGGRESKVSLLDLLAVALDCGSDGVQRAVLGCGFGLRHRARRRTRRPAHAVHVGLDVHTTDLLLG